MDRKIRVHKNGDKTYVEKIQHAIIMNDGYCPCATEKSEDTKCICAEFRGMIDRGEKGECHCGLYVIEEE